jgi:RNA polymerase sigma-70 factor (ECF subfamily)
MFLGQVEDLRAYALGLTGDAALADDAVQECFVVVSEKAADFAPGTNFKAWTRQILRFKVLEMLRLRGRAGGFPSELVEVLAAEAPPPERWEAERQVLRRCLDALGPSARSIIEFRHLDGLYPAVIAARMAWTLNSVHVALSRARATLRDCIQRATVERSRV